MRDIDVRKALFVNELNKFKEDGESRVVEELCLCQGDARVDVAVINGELHGYEIKSKKDTLDRLAGQVEIYSKVLDRATLVVEESHLKKALDILPEWWGVMSVWEEKREIRTYWIRRTQHNPFPDSFALAQLLWREEALELLAIYDLHERMKSKPRRQLWEKLAASLPYSELNSGVRAQLKKRSNWRVAPQQIRHGGSRRPLPKSSDSPGRILDWHSL